ncbi:DUF3040 domain-containing protein [Actinophytocola sp.]|uniref:DUF3040 domain-containing protein n=1 Tax=Actinophytocola sp. TaxID=1872138 RepID=UPI003D6C0DD6
MLSDHERETLREIQRQLVVDDPDLERSFRALEKPTPTRTPPPQGRWAYTAGIAVAAVLAVVLLLAGSLGGALAFAVIAGSVSLARHLDHAARQRKRGD